MSNRVMIATVLLACCVALIACMSPKKLADDRIRAVDQALAGIRPEAAIYVPDQLKAAEDALASTKESFQQGEYQQALQGTNDLWAKARDLTTAVAAQKDELAKTWQQMSGDFPGMVKTIQSRIDILSRSRKLPAGLDKNKFESVKASLTTVTQNMDEASNAFKGGNLRDAVNKAKASKDKAAEIMTALGMKVP